MTQSCRYFRTGGIQRLDCCAETWVLSAVVPLPYFSLAPWSLAFLFEFLFLVLGLDPRSCLKTLSVLPSLVTLLSETYFPSQLACLQWSVLLMTLFVTHWTFTNILFSWKWWHLRAERGRGSQISVISNPSSWIAGQPHIGCAMRSCHFCCCC